MKTTNMYVEMIMIGYMELIWIALLFLCFYKIEFELDAFFSKDRELLMAIGLITPAYILGIVVDRVSDKLTEFYDERVRNKLQEEASLTILQMQSYLFVNVEGFDERIFYQQHRLRILRGSIFNIAAIAVFGCLYLLLLKDVSSALIFFVSAILLLTGVVFSFSKVTYSYWKRTKLEYELYSRRALKSTND